MLKPRHLVKGDTAAIVSLSAGTLGEPWAIHNGKIMDQLIDLPNIGPVLAEELKQGGIDTTEALREAGAEAGVKKSQLTPERKADRREFFDSMSKK